MKNDQNKREQIASEIIKLFVDNKISYAEAGEIMYLAKKKMERQLVQDY